MNGQELYPEVSRSLDSLRQMRLLALLGDMVDDGGKVKAAKVLGVNYRTLSRAVESGTLTDRMADALERHLLLGGGTAAAQQRERVESMERRLAGLQGDLGGRLDAVVEEVKALRDEHARAMRHVERRLVRLESGRSESEAPSATGREPEPAKRRYVPPRQYPQLVTPEAEPGEEDVYGDATPVVVEWRKARDEYHRAAETGTEVEIREAQERMLHLEIAIIEEHELTLPPASYPLNEEWRREEVRQRIGTISWARVERKRALLRRWVRRILTCGIWRK